MTSNDWSAFLTASNRQRLLGDQRHLGFAWHSRMQHRSSLCGKGLPQAAAKQHRRKHRASQSGLLQCSRLHVHPTVRFAIFLALWTARHAPRCSDHTVDHGLHLNSGRTLRCRCGPACWPGVQGSLHQCHGTNGHLRMPASRSKGPCPWTPTYRG